MNSSPPIIVASRMDPASQNIAQTLKAQHSFTEIDRAGSAKIYRSGEVSLVVIEKQCIHADPDDIPLRGSSVIFASKHVSEAQRPAITVHATGNLTKQAEFGGRPEEVSYVEPFRLKTALRRLKEEAAKARVQIEVTMEATHHGPTSFVIPIFFLEIGSAPKEWSDTKLGEIASNAIMAAARSADTKGTNVVGFGGAHYSAKHTRIALEEDYQIGHSFEIRARSRSLRIDIEGYIL